MPPISYTDPEIYKLITSEATADLCITSTRVCSINLQDLTEVTRDALGDSNQKVILLIPLRKDDGSVSCMSVKGDNLTTAKILYFDPLGEKLEDNQKSIFVSAIKETFGVKKVLLDTMNFKVPSALEESDTAALSIHVLETIGRVWQHQPISRSTIFNFAQLGRTVDNSESETSASLIAEIKAEHNTRLGFTAENPANSFNVRDDQEQPLDRRALNHPKQLN